MDQNTRVGVVCQFAPDGRIQVQRVRINNAWISVGQGRQWQDDEGCHVLVMLPNQTVRELVLRSDTLRWELRPERSSASRWA